MVSPLEPPPVVNLTLSTLQREERAQSTSATLRLVAVCLLVLTLIAAGFTIYVAREFLIPIAIAFLLALMTSPIARWLEGHGL